ncbi:hypothetical protein BDF21DRAFT_425464 [Thamnidium elegans]|nr:hypothetical protein BDF21DRAFT_425464 [Thamnidium elegans]
MNKPLSWIFYLEKPIRKIISIAACYIYKSSSYVTYISYTQNHNIFYCSIALIIKLEDCLNS